MFPFKWGIYIMLFWNHMTAHCHNSESISGGIFVGHQTITDGDDCIRDEQYYKSGSVIKVNECIIQGHHLAINGKQSLIIGNHNTLNGIELTAIGDHGTINGVNCHVYGHGWDLNGIGGKVEWGNARSLNGISNKVVDGTCVSISGISNSCSKGINHVDDENEMNCDQCHTELDIPQIEAQWKRTHHFKTQ